MKSGAGSAARLAFVSMGIPVLVIAGAVVQAEAQSLPDTLRVAALEDWPPHYQVVAGAPSGFAIDVTDAVARRAGMAVRYQLFPGFSEATRALLDGEIDVIPDMGAITSRVGEIAFTRPFDVFEIDLFVRDTNGAEDISQVAGPVGAVETNAGVQMMTEQYPDMELRVYGGPEEALFDLVAGGIDAVVYPDQVFLALARSVGIEESIRILPGSLGEVPRAMALRPDDQALVAALDSAVANLISSAEYGEIRERWFGAPMPFWTIGRVVGAGASLLLLTVLGMGLWRYRTAERLARDLQDRIEERDRAEAALKAEEVRFRTLVETTYEGIMVTDSDFKVTFVNDRACEILGRSREEILGVHGAQFVTPEGQTVVRDEMARRQAGVSSVYDATVRLPAGGERSILVASAPLMSEEGTLSAVIASFTDVTERRRLTRELSQVQKLEAIGRLAGGLAHDFNNVLTVIQGNAELILDEAEEPTVRMEAGEILESAARVQAMTRQLLAFSRQGEAVSELVQPARVVSEMESMIQRLIGVDVDLTIETAQSEGVVRCSSAALGQLFLNVIVNARDALPDGGRIAVTVEDLDLVEPRPTQWGTVPPGRFVHICIRDDGIGMSKETLERIFEPFFTTKDVGHGTGLGLANVYGVVQRYHAHMDVESEEGQGTRFSFFFSRVAPSSQGDQGDPVPPSGAGE